MSNTTLGGVTLHDGNSAIIILNDCSKESFLTPMPMYLYDSDMTDIFDFGGVTKVINLTGSYVAGSIAALKTWIDSVEVLVQGHQDTDAGYPLTFVDDLRGSIKVKIYSFSSTIVEAELRTTWTLKLIQSSENS